MFESIKTHFASYILLICNIHRWVPFLFTAPGPRQCMTHDWDHNDSFWHLWPFKNSLLLDLSYSIALLLLCLRKNFFHKNYLFTMYFNSLISDLKMNATIWVSFYVSGEFKYKNVVLAVTSRI